MKRMHSTQLGAVAGGMVYTSMCGLVFHLYLQLYTWHMYHTSYSEQCCPGKWRAVEEKQVSMADTVDGN